MLEISEISNLEMPASAALNLNRQKMARSHCVNGTMSKVIKTLVLPLFVQ